MAAVLVLALVHGDLGRVSGQEGRRVSAQGFQAGQHCYSLDCAGGSAKRRRTPAALLYRGQNASHRPRRSARAWRNCPKRRAKCQNAHQEAFRRSCARRQLSQAGQSACPRVVSLSTPVHGRSVGLVNGWGTRRMAGHNNAQLRQHYGQTPRHKQEEPLPFNICERRTSKKPCFCMCISLVLSRGQLSSRPRTALRGAAPSAPAVLPACASRTGANVVSLFYCSALQC